MNQKHIISIICFVWFIASNSPINGQDIPPPNPELAINIYSGQSIVFVFDEMSEYKNGIMNAGHSTFVRVLCVTDWQLHFKADQPIFYGLNNPSNTLQLDNVGVVVLSTGINLDDGSNTINYAQMLPLALQSSDVLLLSKGTGSNKGGGLRNSFTFNWEVGTMRGNMNPLSILEQHIAADTYNLNIILTVSPVF
jgi:hypothetical protein